MKKFIFILFVGICLIANAVSYKDQRGIIRMIYGGDTLIFQFVGDTNQFTGNNKFFDITGAVTFDSIRFKNSVSWYSALLAPSNSVDVSSAPDSAIFMEMNDTIGWLATVYYSKGKLVIPGIYVNASSDTNKIINTSGTGKNLIRSANENIFDADQNSFKINGTTKAWHDINGFHAYVSDMDTLILGDDTITNFTDRINEFVIDSNLINRQELGDSIDSLETRIGCKLHVNISKDGNITSFNTLVTLTAYVNETGITYNWDGGAGSNKTLITPTTGNHNVVVSKSGCINDTAEIYIVDQTDFHENYNIELPPYSATDTLLSKNYHPGLSSVDTSSAFTATELLVATGSTTAASEDSATWSGGGINITGDVEISDTLSVSTVKINGGNTNPTGTTRLNIEGTIVPYNIWAYAANPVLGNGIIQGTYSGATTTYSGIRGVASGGGIGVLAETQTFVGGIPLYVKSAILGDSKHSIFMNGSDTLMVLDSISFRVKNIFSIQDSFIVYPDSSVFTGYHVADSFVMTDRTTVSDFVFEKGYNYGSFWDDLQYAMQNKTLPALKERSRNLATRQENTIESLERLYLQMAEEFIKRDNEIIRLERKIDRIELLKNEKLIYALIIILFGLVFILMIKKK